VASSHGRSPPAWFALASAFIATSSIKAVNLNTGVAIAESLRSRSGLKLVVRIEIGLATDIIVQFEYSAWYCFVSSEEERNEGISEASKKGRILEGRASRFEEGLMKVEEGLKKTGDDGSSG
jgi:hypothetical protein